MDDHHLYTNPEYYHPDDLVSGRQTYEQDTSDTASSHRPQSAVSAFSSTEGYQHQPQPFVYDSYPSDGESSQYHQYTSYIPRPAGRDDAHVFPYNLARPSRDSPFPTDFLFTKSHLPIMQAQQPPMSIQPAQVMDLKPDVTGLDSIDPNAHRQLTAATKRSDHAADSDDFGSAADPPKKKRSKRSAGKACVYCRRR